MDKGSAGVVLAVCALLLLRLLIGAQRRHRVDSALRRWALAARRRVFLMWHWRASKRAAARVAEEAISRARRKDGPADGEWEGNVYKPKSFRKPPNKLH
jgi:hypothetical protein